MDRRDFIHRFMRGGLLAGILLIPGLFVARRQVTGGAGCIGNHLCNRCRKLDDCSLPEAARERERHKEGST